MELINQILQTIINSFDIVYYFVVNLLTYILISSITDEKYLCLKIFKYIFILNFIYNFELLIFKLNIL